MRANAAHVHEVHADAVDDRPELGKCVQSSLLCVPVEAGPPVGQALVDARGDPRILAAVKNGRVDAARLVDPVTQVREHIGRDVDRERYDAAGATHYGTASVGHSPS